MMLTRAFNGHTPRKSLSRIYLKSISTRRSIGSISSSPNRVPSRSIATVVEHQRLSSNDFPLFNSTTPSFTQPIFLDETSLLHQDTGALSYSKLILQQHMHAALIIGQFDRAEAFLRKAVASEYDQYARIGMNNAFIRGLMQGVADGQHGATLPRILRWLETEMPVLALSPDADTFAIVCQAIFLQENQLYRARMLRRYLEASARMGLLEQTLASGEFSDQEWSEILLVRPDYQHLSPFVSEEQSLPIEQPELPKSTDIRVTDQRGLGLKTLVSGFSSTNFANLADADPEQLTAAQRHLESSAISAEVERWKMERAKMLKHGRNPVLSSKSMESILWTWQTQLEAKIIDHISFLKNHEDKKMWDRLGGDYLQQVPSDKLAAITIMNILALIQSSENLGYISVQRIVNTIANCVRFERTSLEKSNVLRQRRFNQRHGQLKLEMKNLGELSVDAQVTEAIHSIERTSWPEKVRAHVGGFLISQLVEVAQLPAENGDIAPAYKHETIWKNGKLLGVLHISDNLKTKLQSYPVALAANAHHLPMVAKPSPWDSIQGAYLTNGASLMRHEDVSKLQQMYLQAAINSNDVPKVFQALNVISQTPWRINQPLLDIMIQAWNTGEAVTNFPPVDHSFDYPSAPAEDASADDKKKHRHHIRQLNNIKSGYQSNRCFINLQLEIAKRYSGIDFYVPHNIDFRGRAYPVPGILNHMGADNARALFLFAKGRELGEHGLYWLKNHVATVYGLNKASAQERQQFVEDNMQNIRDSVANPLNGERWWMKADDPWQCLGACLEVVAAIDSPDATKFVSHFPVHQDGTCNGLQHYAALGGDHLGAAQVNLVPGDRPADIYNEVANIVRSLIQKDIEATNDPLAKEALPLVVRKIVKRPVMTNVYGVTFVGAVNQVRKEIDEILPPTQIDRPFNNHQISVYIVRHIFKAFGSLFAGATAIQHWLAESAATIASSVSPEQIQRVRDLLNTQDTKYAKKPRPVDLQSAVIFTTPLGMPVVQPYRVEARTNIKTTLQHLSMKSPSKSCPILKRRQKAALPPNFVHSLDATHMMLTSIKADEAGISFAAVHDSFWTHAADVPVLNEALRDTFVDLHSENIMERLYAEFQQRYKGFMAVRTVPQFSPLGKKILALRRSLRVKKNEVSESAKTALKSLPHPSELIMEQERINLLQSENAELRTKGEKMITPASLLLSSNPEDWEVPEATVTVIPEGVPNVDGLVEEATAELAEQGTLKQAATLPKKPTKMLKVWAPTTFDNVPQKGDFDVTTVKDSEYFFS